MAWPVDQLVDIHLELEPSPTGTALLVQLQAAPLDEARAEDLLDRIQQALHRRPSDWTSAEWDLLLARRTEVAKIAWSRLSVDACTAQHQRLWALACSERRLSSAPSELAISAYRDPEAPEAEHPLY